MCNKISCMLSMQPVKCIIVWYTLGKLGQKSPPFSRHVHRIPRGGLLAITPVLLCFGCYKNIDIIYEVGTTFPNRSWFRFVYITPVFIAIKYVLCLGCWMWPHFVLDHRQTETLFTCSLVEMSLTRVSTSSGLTLWFTTLTTQYVYWSFYLIHLITHSLLQNIAFGWDRPYTSLSIDLPWHSLSTQIHL